MGDEDHRGVDRLELPLEPLEVLDVEVVRRLVEEQEVGPAREDARERGPRQLPAGERPERPVELVLGEAEARGSPRPRDRASPSRRRARAAPARPRSGEASARRARRPPSPPRVAGAPPRGSSRSRAPERAYSRSVRSNSSGGRWSWSATRVPFAKASFPPWSDVSPAIARRSVVFPAPFGPASDRRSRRPTVKETPSKSGSPENSLRSSDAIRTAMDGRRLAGDARGVLGRRAAARPPRCAPRRCPLPPGARSGFPELGISRHGERDDARRAPPRPRSAASTASPRPPSGQWSSTVTSRPFVASAAARSVSVSSGLIE